MHIYSHSLNFIINSNDKVEHTFSIAAAAAVQWPTDGEPVPCLRTPQAATTQCGAAPRAACVRAPAASCVSRVVLPFEIRALT